MSALVPQTRPRERRADSQAAFLAASASLLAEGNSFNDLTIAALAERAGRSRTAFYFCFQDKNELLTRLTESLADHLFDEADRWWSGAGGPEDLRSAIEAILVTYRDHATLLRAVVETSARDDEVGIFWRGLITRFIDATEQRLSANGRAPGGWPSPRATAFVLVWMTERAAYQHVVQGGRLDDVELADALVDVWQRTVYLEA